MIHPLVQNDDGPFRAAKMGDGVLGQDGDPVGVDHFRNTVVDLGINMVGASGQDDALDMVVLHILQDPLAFLTDILTDLVKLLPARRCRVRDLSGRNIPEFPDQGLCDRVQAGKSHEGIAETDLTAADLLHVVADVLRIGGDDGAVVMVVRSPDFLPLIEKGRIEDEVHAPVDQPHDMAMGDLGRIAGGFTGNGLNAHLIDPVRGQRGQDDPESQPGKEGIPERIVLIHVQDSGDAHRTSVGVIFAERAVAEGPLQLVLVDIGNAVAGQLFAQASFTAVAGYIFTAAGEVVDGQAAVVGAAAAGPQGSVEFQLFNIVKGQHGSLYRFVIAFSGDQSSAESAHDAGDIGPDHQAVRNGLQGPQDRVIIEGTALDDDISAQLGSVRYFDDLEQGILDDGISQAGGDVRHIGAFLLGLFDTGIHKDGTSCSQVNGMGGKEGCPGEILDGIVQGSGERFNEGAAAGGAGLVEQDIVNSAVADPDAFHILAADIQDAVHIGIKEGGRVIMGNGLDLTVIQHEGGLEQGFAVAGRAGTHDPGVGRDQVMDLMDGPDGGHNRVAVVIAVERVEQGAVFTDHGQLGRGGTGVDAQIAVAVVVLQGTLADSRLIVAGQEAVIFLL